MKPKILISLTTYKNNHLEKDIEDLKRLNVREFAIFMTGLRTRPERDKLYNDILDNLGHVSIPFAHIAPYMEPDEIDFLIDNFGLEAMNLHPVSEFPLIYDYSKYKDKIYMENAGPAIMLGLKDTDIDGYAGLCLDLTHLENSKLQNEPGYEMNLAMAKKYKIGANHLSAITGTIEKIVEHDGTIYKSYDRHELGKLSEMDYIKDYYPEYFGQYAAIELRNSIEEQIEIKKYIEKILGL